MGHKAQDCLGKEVKLLKKPEEEEKGTQVEILADVEKDVGLNDRALSDLLQDLEAITPRPAICASSNDLETDINHKTLDEQHLQAREKAQGIQLIEPTTEAFHTNDTSTRKYCKINVQMEKELQFHHPDLVLYKIS
ncbi:unnamed protein product [Brassica napus]|uniref:(rape) hypothetical protein n=1 Tax=Brassica napus TaxID=3708 RepID=A0A816NRC1_BRANA|nr:unnamed protein product [Brassica napus]